MDVISQVESRALWTLNMVLVARVRCRYGEGATPKEVARIIELLEKFQESVAKQASQNGLMKYFPMAYGRPNGAPSHVRLNPETYFPERFTQGQEFIGIEQRLRAAIDPNNGITLSEEDFEELELILGLFTGLKLTPVVS